MNIFGSTQIHCGSGLAREGVIEGNGNHSTFRVTQYPTVQAMQVAKVPQAMSINASCADHPVNVAQLLKS